MAKVRQVGRRIKYANNLELNKPLFKQYLINNLWTSAHTTGQWGKDKYDCNVFGKMTDCLLSNTKGISINPYDGVYIAHFKQDGDVTKPYIRSSEGKFEIIE